MIRICLAAAAALLIAGCSKAPEDVTARYALGGGQASMIVKAAGNGDARIDSGGQTLIRHDGKDYLLAKDSQGSFSASVEDFIAVMVEMLKETGLKPPTMPEQPEFVLAKGGKETVGGVEGDVWKVQTKADPKTDAADAVVSEDPTLANVGKAMQIQNRLGVASMEQMQGGRTSLDRRIEEMLAKGTVLRFGPTVRLDKIERGPIDASNFALPGTILDKAALKKRLVAERERVRALRASGAGAAGPGQLPPAQTPNK
jgi:hypothetical protein